MTRPPLADVVVPIVSTATTDLHGVARRLPHRRRPSGPRPGRGRRLRLPGQLVRFAAIGVASTLAYAALYAFLRERLDPSISNALALVATAVANTAANRRLTFDVRGGDGALRAQLAGFLALGIALGITSAAIDVLPLVAPRASRAVEVVLLVVANLVATVVRFVVLRRFIARPVPATLS